MRFTPHLLSVVTCLVAASTLPACAVDDGTTDIVDFEQRQVNFTRPATAEGGFEALLESSNCGLLHDDAFARLNGAPIQLFRGSKMLLDQDGGFQCKPPSVSVGAIDAPPPWTIEIGDASLIVSVTLEPINDNPIELLPLEGATVTYPGGDALAVPIAYSSAPQTGFCLGGFFQGPDGWASSWNGLLEATDVRLSGPIGQTPGPPQAFAATVTVGATAISPLLQACDNATCTGWNACSGPTVSRTYAITVQCLYSFCLG